MKTVVAVGFLLVCLVVPAVARNQGKLGTSLTVRRADSHKDQLHKDLELVVGEKYTVNIPQSEDGKDDAFVLNLTGRLRDKDAAMLEVQIKFHDQSLLTSFDPKRAETIRVIENEDSHQPNLAVMDQKGNLEQLIPLSDNWLGLNGTTVRLEAKLKKP